MKEKGPCPTCSGIGAALVAGIFFTLIGCANVMSDANASMKQKDGNTKSAPVRQQVAPAVFPYSDKVPLPKWPQPPAESHYKPGMSAKEYFDILCKTEAGEFIYRTVENVEGVYQMRPREHVTDKMLQDRYFLEDPYGHQKSHAEKTDVGSIQDGYVNPPYADAVKLGYVLYKPNQNYNFLEKPILAFKQNPADGAKYLRYTRPNTDKLILENGKYLYPRNGQPQLFEERMVQLKSRYGFTWRGIERPHDRELGIAGGELIVLDLQTNEILALRRGFLRSGEVLDSPTGIFWLGAQACPPRPVWATKEFLHKVLKPLREVK